jgi:hypothetical protein
MYIGLWAGKYDVVVGSAQHGLTAYNDVNGAKLWSWAPPKNGALCGMSPGTDNGLAAFEFAAPAPGTDTPVCNELQAVDVDSGGTHWAKPLNLSASPSSGTPARDQSIDISVEDGLVGAPYLTGADAADALAPDSDILLASLMTGKTAWTTDFGQSTLPDGCVLEGHAQVRGRNVYALAACANHTRVDLLTIGGGATADIADDGALPDCSTTPDAISGARLVADSDAVLIVCTSDGVQTNLYAFTVQSNGPIRLKPSTNLLSVGFDMSSTAEPGSALLHSTTLYLSDSTEDGSGTASSKTSVIRALDLLTGAQLWSASIPGARAGIAVSADDHSVEVAAVPAGSGPATMNTYDARSGTQTASVNLNAATSSALAGLSGPGQGVPSTVTLPGSRVAVLIPGKGTLAVFPLTG